MNTSVSDLPQIPFVRRGPYLSEEQVKRAKVVPQFLIALSKDESEKELSSLYRQAADFFREKTFGKSDRVIWSALVKAFEEYFDGEKYIGVEIDNLCELIGIKADLIAPVLQKMIEKGEVSVGRRRRYNELGEHYSQLFKLKG